jgi:hypothetical protein
MVTARHEQNSRLLTSGKGEMGNESGKGRRGRREEMGGGEKVGWPGFVRYLCVTI